MNLRVFINDLKLKPAEVILALVISVIGLTTITLVIMLYITDRSIDRSISEYKQLYRIESQFNLPNGDVVRSAKIPFPLVEALQEHPDIESIGYAWRLNARLNHQGSIIPHISVFAVTPVFMEQLHPFSPHLPVPGPHDIYITDEFNRQYLGHDEPLGKIVDLGKSGQFIIKAIVEPQPNSSLNLSAIIAFTPELVEGYNDKRLDWYDTHIYAFARLHSGHSHFNQQILSDIVTHNAPQLAGVPFTPSSFLNFSARHILDMHYNHGYADEFATTREKSLLYILYAAALFVLLSTTINFFIINGILNAARLPSLHIKRSVGASNTQLLTETLSLLLPQFLITVVLAVFFLWGLAQLSPDINKLFACQSVIQILGIFTGVALFNGLLMLCAHLLNLSLFIYGKQTSHSLSRYQSRQIDYRNRIMMMIQLVVTGITVYLWAGVMMQNHITKNTDFGYQKTQRLTFSLDEGFYSLGSMHELQQRLKEIDRASNLSLSSWQPFDMSRQLLSVQHAQQPVDDQFAAVNALFADKNFIDVWGLTTLAGGKNRLLASSHDHVAHALVTREFMHAMGQTSFDEVLNTRYYIPYPEQPQELRVLRIVENFDLGEHLPSPQPLIIFINDRLEKFATLSYSHQHYLPALTTLLKHYGPPGLSIQTVEQMHNHHFQNAQLMLNIIMFSAILALAVTVISTLIISISETQRLNNTLKIMEAVGGSIATSMVFFLRLYFLPIVLSLVIALVSGSQLLKNWLQQYQSVSRVVYINAFGSLLLLGLVVVAIMAIALVLCHVQGTRRQLKRNPN